MAKHRKKIILELNNIDLLGRRFNGYNILEYFSKHEEPNFSVQMLVNNRKPYSSKTKNLFPSGYLEEYDWVIQATERNLLGVKNQLSLAEPALTSNKLYKQASVLHFHLYHNMNLPIEFLTRIDKHKQIIIDIHDTFWLTDSSIPMLEVFNYTNQNAASLNAQRKRVLNSIDAHFIVHSPYILKLFQKSSITKNIQKVSLINFGIDTQVFKPFSPSKIQFLRKKFNIPPENIVIFCRAQSNFKGASYIKKALQSLSASQPITILTVVEKNLFDDLKDKYQIIDMGVVYQDSTMAELFNICDIFLSPSTEESFGFMAAESMACGKPVIVFDGTALPDTTHSPDIGLSVPKNATALKNAIISLINNPEERQTRGKLGREYVALNYTMSNYYHQYSELFNSLLNSPPRNTTDVTTPKAKQDEIKSFQKILATLQKEINNPSNTIPLQQQYPVINYNNQEIQNLIQEFNLSNYQKLQKVPPKLRLKYFIKRIIPEPIIKRISIAANQSRRIIPSPIRKIVKKIIRRS